MGKFLNALSGALEIVREAAQEAVICRACRNTRDALIESDKLSRAELGYVDSVLRDAVNRLEKKGESCDSLKQLSLYVSDAYRSKR